LRDVRSLSEFIGAVKVGAGIANDMLDDLEHRLLDCIEQIGREWRQDHSP
jgi:hypothetical protein